MKYVNEVEINLPISKVLDLFDNTDNLRHWQPGFVSFEHLSGTPGLPGAKSKLKYKMGKREIELVETITVRDLPREFSGVYEARGVSNSIRNYFSEPGTNKTKWVSECEFTFSGFMKMIAWIMPGTFKKQSQKYLELFKEFAEKEGAN